MRVVVPYAERAPKSRLSAELDADERRAFARAMLADVLSAVREAGETPTVLTPDADAVLDDTDARVVVDERPLTPAVNAVLDGADAATSPVAVVMADLALATPSSLRRLFDAEGDVVVAPGRGGGTNALVVRHPAFRADYHGVSYRDHREGAADAGLDAAVVDSMRLATDVDEPADLAEVLLHGDGRARTWLEDAGFELDASGGRVGVSRD